MTLHLPSICQPDVWQYLSGMYDIAKHAPTETQRQQRQVSDPFRGEHAL